MKKDISPKQRALTAFAREAPDRVPINYSANPGIDKRLKTHFGLKENDGEGLLKALGVDFRGAGARYAGPKLHKDAAGEVVDNWGIHRRWIEHDTGGYWDFCHWPLAEATVEEVEAWPMPSPDDFDYSGVLEHCKRYATYAIYAGNPGVCDIINTNGMLRTMEQTLVDLITDNPAGLRLADRRGEIQLEVLRHTIEAAEGGIDFLWIGEDLGTQIGPLISKELYRRHIRPRHQRFVDLAKAYGLPVMIHSCGSSSWAFDDFIDMGIDAVDTLQPEAKDMSPAYLKKRFGDRLAFHGCISTAGPVAQGAVEDVVRNCRETLQVMMPGGGYCFAPTHCLQDNSPTENVVAMYETARTFGRYG
ncbi:MAG: uroporphyrinogen decarboxylase family protein [Planctomycetota bacterium]|jgi:uroporphyrinogen decarboxylase